MEKDFEINHNDQYYEDQYYEDQYYKAKYCEERYYEENDYEEIDYDELECELLFEIEDRIDYEFDFDEHPIYPKYYNLDKKSIKDFDEKIHRFKWKYSDLTHAMLWGCKDESENSDSLTTWFEEESILSAYFFLEEYSEWHKKLDDKYDIQRVEFIEYRIVKVQFLLDELKRNIATNVKYVTLYEIAYNEMSPYIMKQLELLKSKLPLADKIAQNLLGENSDISNVSMTDSPTNPLIQVDLYSSVHDLIQIEQQNSQNKQNSNIFPSKFKSIEYWNATDKSRFLSMIFPNEDPPDLARIYSTKLQVLEATLNRNIHKHRKGELSNSKIDIDFGVNAIKVFLEIKSI